MESPSGWRYCTCWQDESIKKEIKNSLVNYRFIFINLLELKPATMHYTLDKTEKYAVIKLHEQKLNTLISAELKSELLIINSQGYNNIILDLSDTQYCDSSGLSAVLVGNRVCRNASGSFVLTGLSEPIKKLIAISQLEQVLVITPTLNEAIEYLFSDEIQKP